MANVNNLRIGPCQLTWKGTDLGFTLGGVKFIYERKLTDLRADKYGESPIDKVLTGTNATVEVKLAEPVISIIRRLLPEGSDFISGANEQIGLAAGEGASMRSAAGLLTLHPLSKSAGDFSEDVNLYLAVPADNNELNYEVANQKVFAVKFMALVDEEYVAGRRLGHLGPVNIS